MCSLEAIGTRFTDRISEKGGGNHRRRVVQAIIEDINTTTPKYNTSLQTKELITNVGITDNFVINNETINDETIIKLANSLEKSMDKERLKVDCKNIAKLEEGFDTVRASKEAEKVGIRKIIKLAQDFKNGKAPQIIKGSFEEKHLKTMLDATNAKGVRLASILSLMENESKVNKLERLNSISKEVIASTAERGETLETLLKQAKNSICFRDYMSAGILRRIAQIVPKIK